MLIALLYLMAFIPSSRICGRYLQRSHASMQQSPIAGRQLAARVRGMRDANKVSDKQAYAGPERTLAATILHKMHETVGVSLLLQEKKKIIMA
ncbi:hypothetical protein F5Y07DRAFT_364947 [Xylaria sp. FL0933]|nr:hypothetical protein F5Y07DRAFT_364947 [Xylaria sp. FL0933]